VWTPENAYGKGQYEVWYLPAYRPKGERHDYSHPSLRAYDFAFDKNPIYIEEVQETYIRLGSIAARSLDDVYAKMQGERWGKGEESNAFLRSVGADHTSMMMGDVIHVDGKWMMVADFGFRDLKHRPTLDRIRGE
jgi:hypothetical protein